MEGCSRLSCLRPDQDQLARMLAEMRALNVPHGDIEMNHADADKLLCEALRLLGQNDLVEAFEAVDKWYA